MILPIPFLSAIELAINTWLKLDGEALSQLEALEGKIIQFHITGVELNLYFLPATSGIQVLGSYPDSEDGGTVDACITGSPIALIKLSTAKNSGETLLKSDVVIDGDMRVAEKFSAILREVDIDWEELFSKLFGDIMAHQAGQTSRSVKDWALENTEAMKLNVSEYITEESRLSPTGSEIEHFMSQVDETRMAVDRLDARIRLLQNKTAKDQ